MRGGMDHDRYDDEYIARILRTTKTIAVVGASANEERASNYVSRYLSDVGYDVIPVNPGHAGKEIAGRLTYARLADIPGPIDMVDVFRRSEDVPSVVEEALKLDPLPKVIWMQQDIRNDAAAAMAEAAGVEVVMDRCPKIEYPRLLGGSRR
jgi:predicted CoA-binding protein